MRGAIFFLQPRRPCADLCEYARWYACVALEPEDCAGDAVRDSLNFNQAPDVHLRFLAEIAFDAAFRFDGGTQVRHFIFSQVLNLLGRIDIGFLGQGLRARLPDAVDRRQANPQPLVRRQIHTCDTCHKVFPLTLALAVLRVRTNHANHAAPMNDLALHADFLY